MRPLAHRTAVVCGATRGVGRGIACMLGEAGATVFCTGRSIAGQPPSSGAYAGRPETIEETAAMVTAHGGAGIAARVDHDDAAAVAAFAAGLARAPGQVDIVVLNFWGDDVPVPFGTPFWSIPIDAGRRTIERTLWSYVQTLQALAPLLIDRPVADGQPPRVVVFVADGPALYYRSSLFYDLAATLRVRLAYAVAEELAPHRITVLAVSPGYVRTELTLERFGVTAENWRTAVTQDAGWLESETPCFVGRGIAALAADPTSVRWAGGLHGSWDLARAYGVRDVDGATPDFGAYFQRVYGETPSPPRTTARWRLTQAAPALELDERRAHGKGGES